MDVDLGTVIVARTVTWVPTKGTPSDVTILIGAPRDSDEFGGVIVPFQMRGLGSERVKFAGGVDGIQAFLLTLRMIRVDLECYQHELDGRLIWLDDESGSCGLVAPENA